MRLVIIGGSDAGISAGLRAREKDRTADVNMIVADAYPNFSICGLPFYLSGEVSDWRSLAHRTRAEIEASGIRLNLNASAVSINIAGKHVITRSQEGIAQSHPYDRLVIATGAAPVQPPIEGIDLPNVFVLHTMDDCFALHSRLEGAGQSAIIVGAGYIGLEMADALRHRGVNVTLIERLPTVMRTVDGPISKRVESVLIEHGVDVRTGIAVEAILQKEERLQVRCGNGLEVEGDFVLVVVGVRPQSDLAKTCGVNTNERGAIVVDRGMRTNLPDIWAAGDCTTTWHRLLERDLYLPLGTTSHKQGRVAGENAAGGSRKFAGTLGTQSVKLFDRVIAATGLREDDTRSYGFIPLAVEAITYDHKVYYPGATELVVRLIGDSDSGALLGAQLFGSFGKEVSKRIDSIAMALHHRMRIDDLNELDLSYTPPLSSPWDPLQIAAQAWMAARDRLPR
jgi:NADPH-dependent 2,4-dienoyl-CoA reductase/sulfur reductase-like enzyme